ncbi:hypothetical protein L5515_002239 [Caenorhabditis briggsae]|uniref:Uncharacterized protein n=1 Tax=Caenorhabditis briggsae TaxID=6238 RepID=A0AAE9E575_CAEBR|nr:hypothetical protein L5515_002239 [Caenorhabditis briggsae]
MDFVIKLKNSLKWVESEVLYQRCKIVIVLLISFLVLCVLSQEFSGIISDQRCMKDSECIGSDVCHVRRCLPISELRQCDMSPDGDDCGFEYFCVGGVCRYMSDISMGRKHSFVPMTCTHPLECPDNRKCVNGQCV